MLPLSLLYFTQNFMALLQIRFCKKILGIFFFCDAVDTDIHEERKNKITTTGAKRLQLAQLNKKNLRVILQQKIGFATAPLYKKSSKMQKDIMALPSIRSRCDELEMVDFRAPQRDFEQVLTIILVTFNSGNIIFEALSRLNFDKYNVVVVDNKSSDDTTKIISENFPRAKLVKNSKNIGYGRANNIALREVKTEFSLLLNVDASIEEACIDKVVGLLKQNSEVAISCPIIYSTQFDEGFLKIKKNRHYSEDDNFYYNQFVTGAAMFLNMHKMKKIGFFDERFFLYCEDNEICKRAIKMGYKTAIIKNIKCYHLGGKSSNLTDDERVRIYWHKFGWSKLYYTQKIWGRKVAILKAIRMILKFSFLMLKELIKTKKIDVAKKTATKACLAFLVGVKAFDSNDNPSG
jgi:GT2 family glycosyltransferase